MSQNITKLREHLFATLADLRDPQKPMEIERAQAVANVAKVVIDTAKVEVDYMRVSGGDGLGTGFIGSALPLPAGGSQQIEDHSLAREIEAVLSPLQPGELTFEALQTRLVEKLQRPVPDLPDALDHLKHAGRIRETRAGRRVTLRWLS
jgi:hypothetical protein